MKRQLTTVVFLCLATSGFSPLFGQTYGLKQILDLSRANYPSIKARSEDVKGAISDVKAASSEYIPKLSAQHQYTYATSNSMAGAFYPNPTVISPSGGIRTGNASEATWGSYTSVLLEWNVFNFGRVRSSVNAAQAQAEAGQAAFDNEVFQHMIRVSDAYLLTLMSEKLMAVQRANLERALRFHQAVRAGVNSGLRAGVDSSLASAEHAKAKLILLDAERNYRAQQLRLKELTGISGSGTIAIDTLDFLRTIPVKPDTAFSPKTNPLLNLYRARVEATRARSVAFRRSTLPSVTLVGAAWARGSGVYGDDSFHTDFSSGTKYQVSNYLVGAALRWTITDLAVAHQRYQGEQHRAARDRELYNEQSLQVERQLGESNLQYDVSLEQARMAPVQLTAARQAYQQANARYRSGLTDLPTLMQSMFILNRAEADLAIAYVNAWRSLLATAAASGDFSVFTNSLP